MGEPTTDSLFDHYGIELMPKTARRAPHSAVEAIDCSRCGWLLAVRRNEQACPMCGEPAPAPEA